MASSRTVGVIDIGSSAIRMVVMEIHPDGTFNRLDRASKPINLGRDVFVNRLLGRDTIQQAIRILAGFRELLKAWSIHNDNVYAVATSAIREAHNRELFLDRVQIRTGLKIRIVDGVEENHLTYIAVLHALGEAKASFLRNASVIVEIGGGSTELMIMDRGKMVASHLYRLGTLRFDHQYHGHGPGQGMDVLGEQFRLTIDTVKAEFSLSKIKNFVMVGGDARTAAHHCGERAGDHYSVISREKFLAFLNAISTYTNEECVKKLNITYYEAETLIPALDGYRLFLEETQATELLVPDVSIREGVLLRFALGYDERTQKQYEAQVLASAMSLGRKYHFEEDHALYINKVTSLLFSSLEKEHGLHERERMLLQIASLLHDIGTFVRSESHHKHGSYIVANSEVFGLGAEDLTIISQIVRYHRSNKPSLEHHEFAMLSHLARLSVIKCAALLRLAEALDRSHTQRIKILTARVDEENLVITTSYQGDLSLERAALLHKSDLFDDVFGLHVVLEHAG